MTDARLSGTNAPQVTYSLLYICIYTIYILLVLRRVFELQWVIFQGVHAAGNYISLKLRLKPVEGEAQGGPGVLPVEGQRSETIEIQSWNH